jgi:teichuronic acid biosynthesis glycosyltransferase TuaC
MVKNKILWLHNFNPKYSLNSGVFMLTFYKYLLNNGMEIDLYYVGSTRSVTNLIKQMIVIRKKARNYHIVHVQYGSILSFLVKASLIGLNINKVITLRGSDFYRNKISGKISNVHSFIAVFLTRLSIHSFDKVVVSSERMRREVARDFSLNFSQIVVQPSPVDVAFFDIDNTKRINETKKILFGAVNIKSKLKRHRLALDAMSIVIKNTKDRYKVEMIVAEKIPHNRMKELYNSCDLMLVTSVYEGWPNVIKESLSCGVPFVATDVSDLKLVADRSNRICSISQPDKFELARKIEESISRSLSHKERLLLKSLVMEMSLEATMKKIEGLYASFKTNR